MRDLPTITKNLLIINVLMFAADYVFGRLGINLSNLLGLHFLLASDFHIYQIITYMFMHGGLAHLFFNMFALWMFGRTVESVWGPKRFLIFYLVCGIGAGLTQEATQLASYFIQNLSAYDSVNTGAGIIPMNTYLNAWTTVGASGAIYGILLAFGMIFPEERIFIFPFPVPIKAKYFVLIYAALELFLGLGQSGDNIAHFAHLGGMLFGWLLIIHWRRQAQRAWTGWNNYRGTNQESFSDKAKALWDKMFKKNNLHISGGNRKQETDWEYNARKKRKQEEIDQILDKVRKSGYDSLTDEEKKKLFISGKN
jgi:membrane associated rhomboid family serine protease